jgi:hypothetical protein
MCQPVSRQSRFSSIFFVQQEPEPEPRASIRFRFFLGQNDTVPAVPVPAPVPQHWDPVQNQSRKQDPDPYQKGLDS